jgi:hypothetical protein
MAAHHERLKNAKPAAQQGMCSFPWGQMDGFANQLPTGHEPVWYIGH